MSGFDVELVSDVCLVGVEEPFVVANREPVLDAGRGASADAEDFGGFTSFSTDGVSSFLSGACVMVVSLSSLSSPRLFCAPPFSLISSAFG